MAETSFDLCGQFRVTLTVTHSCQRISVRDEHGDEGAVVWLQGTVRNLTHNTIT